MQCNHIHNIEAIQQELVLSYANTEHNTSNTPINNYPNTNTIASIMNTHITILLHTSLIVGPQTPRASVHPSTCVVCVQMHDSPLLSISANGSQHKLQEISRRLNPHLSPPSFCMSGFQKPQNGLILALRVFKVLGFRSKV